jgi:ferredoxin
MPSVIAEPCVGCKHTDCVTVCPVDCFHEGETMLYINPETCIDCFCCIPECPVEAIFDEADLPEKWRHYAAINAERSKTLPVINARRAG